MTYQEFNKVLELVDTHTEHNGAYCDTGDDMEWACRSECVGMAIKRLKDYFEPLLSPQEGSNN